METKHTPGPWMVKHSVTKDSFNVVTKKIGCNYKISRCAYLFIDGYPNISQLNKHEAEANAKLIASAPELLQSLNEAKEALEWYMENTKPIENDWQTFHDLGMNVIVKSEEIITKAT